MSLSCRERVRKVGRCDAASFVRLTVHSDIDYSALQERLVVVVVLGIILAVVEDAFYIDVFGAIVRSLNHHLLAIFEVDGSLLE